MSKTRAPIPIMSEDQQRFMAFEGLVQWTAATVEQGERIARANQAMHAAFNLEDASQRLRLCAAQLRTEHHYFAICANKVLEHRSWLERLNICGDLDLSEFDAFPVRDVRDLRNMREHVVDYFKGLGRDTERWRIDTPEFSADASSCAGTVIGGRLDWSAFSRAAEGVLPSLLRYAVRVPKVP